MRAHRFIAVISIFAATSCWTLRENCKHDNNESCLRAFDLTAEARAAAAKGHCAQIASLEPKVFDAHREVHKKEFVLDRSIDGCRKTLQREALACAQARYDKFLRANKLSGQPRIDMLSGLSHCGDDMDPTIREHNLQWDMIRAAAIAAELGDCWTVDELEAEVKRRDPNVLHRVIAVDVGVQRCAATADSEE